MARVKQSTGTPLQSTSAVVKGKNIKVMYNTSEITNRTNGNLWVTFVKNEPANGIVLSMVLSRDSARNATSKMFNTNITNIRSMRVSTYRTKLKNKQMD